MSSSTTFESVPVGADTETTTASASGGSGEIDLSIGETEVITFDMINNIQGNAPNFFASETGPGAFDAASSPDGIFEFTITHAQWLAAGSPASITFTFSDDDMSFGSSSTFATYTLNITCFAPGTAIATPRGETAVEALQIGDLIRTADGRDVAVKWVGRQTVSKWRAGAKMQPVRIAAGALGHGLPQTDLTVTADHGMVLDGLVINASALVNGTTIDWVPMADLGERFTVYHVETEDHDIILANGAPAETFIDYLGRQAFDNYQVYLDLYGAERIIREMDAPRISAARLVPASIRRRLDGAEATPAVIDRAG